MAGITAAHPMAAGLGKHKNADDMLEDSQHCWSDCMLRQWRTTSGSSVAISTSRGYMTLHGPHLTTAAQWQPVI